MTSAGEQVDDPTERLERETVRLNKSIEGLTQALTDSASIQARIAGLDERQKLVEKTVMPREEVDAAVADLRRHHDADRRRLTRRFVIAIGIIAVLILGGMVAGLAFSREQHRIQEVQRGLNVTQLTECQHNRQNFDNLRTYLSSQRAVEVVSPDSPALKALRLRNFDAILKNYAQVPPPCIAK